MRPWRHPRPGIDTWGDTGTVDVAGAFAGASNLSHVAEPPQTVTTMRSMFSGASTFNQPIGDWNTANVTDMAWMLLGASTFDQPIGGWDVGNVTDMAGMFYEASSFDQDIGGWDVSGVTFMWLVFYDASSFNRDLSAWCVEKIPSEPSLFDAGADAWTSPRPVWGTCPA